jgi:hypothetical protein
MKALVTACSLFLALFQVTAYECPTSVLVGSLRDLAVTGDPAGDHETEQKANYGDVCPLVFDCAALTVPLPTQPNSMFSIVTSK